jgi:hypothetical protein
LLAHRYPLFTHFDKVRVYREAPMESKPEGISIVAPYDLSEGLPTGVANWMHRSGCIVGLGDGSA